MSWTRMVCVCQPASRLYKSMFFLGDTCCFRRRNGVKSRLRKYTQLKVRQFESRINQQIFLNAKIVFFLAFLSFGTFLMTFANVSKKMQVEHHREIRDLKRARELKSSV